MRFASQRAPQLLFKPFLALVGFDEGARCREGARNRHDRTNQVSFRIVSCEVSLGIMAEENAESAKSVTAELKMYVHCDACERLVRRSVKKIKGVEAVEVDREGNKIRVTGDFKTDKLLKKIKQKTGKKAEILIPEEEVKREEPDAPCDYLVQDQETFVVHEFENRRPEGWDLHYFDDENTEGCVVM